MWQSTQQELGEGVCCPKTSISAAQIGTEDGKPYPGTGSIPDPSVFCTSVPRVSDSRAQRLYLSFRTSVLQTRLAAAQPRLWLKMQDSYDISWQNSTFKPHPRVKLETKITQPGRERTSASQPGKPHVLPATALLRLWHCPQVPAWQHRHCGGPGKTLAPAKAL